MPSIARSNGDSTPQKRRLRSDAAAQDSPISTSVKWKSPRGCSSTSPNNLSNGTERDFSDNPERSPVKKLSGKFISKPKWNPGDTEQMRAVKEALHVSTAPSTIVCRENEQKRVLEFCKVCVEQEKSGSLYVCGCPGTGKSLSMEKVKQLLVDWAKEAGHRQPDVLPINCTSLAKTSDIFVKILGDAQQRRKVNSSATSALQHLQNLYSQNPRSSGIKMTLIIVDELDYLITKDRAVLHDLFMLTTFPFSRCILIGSAIIRYIIKFCFIGFSILCASCIIVSAVIFGFAGIANAIDLADRFLPRLQSLNCKPMVVTFRAYDKDQILKILHERLSALPYIVFQPQALELCARKVAAASGDMRRALCICRSAIEILEAELKDSSSNFHSLTVEKACFEQQTATAPDILKKQDIDVVRLDHMAIALSKTYRTPIVDTIQSLPQHQQILLCSAVKHFRGGKKDTTVGELNKSYMDFCKSSLIPPVGSLELSTICRVLNDQGLLKLGQSREDKSKRVSLRVDEADVTFALQGIRFFRNCLQ
ncbi:cell division control protein 6 homolog B isoform X1 [Juglans microcarpa x Juglans regia]|uniref:cell division control protein 6 homolog B isoform X1 n=1 Tax=Juglans microcarpa x Juglans regia TaxID=2249226 RepID=UPI001B7EBDA7|nr:cell division control protein 6 homolog B isoform X1 [Juglans microcarpa x Juglans regia]